MKKKDIIQLVKKIVKEDAYGSATLTTQGAPRTRAVAPAGEDPYTGRVEYPYTVGAKTKNGMMEAGPSNNPYYNNLVKKAKEMGIHVNDLMKSLLKDKSEEEIMQMGYQDLAALAGVEDLSEEGQSWGLEPRQLADSFTFEELEQLYNDNKITKEDLTGAKGYLQAWIDQHPTYLPQRDLTSPKRQRIRDKYLNESPMFGKKEPFTKDYGSKISPEDFKSKIPVGKTVIYGGTRYEVLENTGYVLTLQSTESGKTKTVNLNQFISQGAIKEKTMKKINEKTFGGKGAVDDMKKAPEFNTLQGPEKEDMIKQLQTGGTVSLEEEASAPFVLDSKTIENLKYLTNFRGDEKIEELTGLANYILDNPSPSFEKPGMGETKYAEPDMDDEDKEQDMADIKADMASMMREYIKERGDDNLMEHLDKYRRRAKLMEGATQKLFKLFNAGKTDAEVRTHHLQMNIDMPEAFISKLRNNWEALRKTKLDLTLADKEAEGFETITPATDTVSGMEDGMEEDKKMASGLFNEIE